MLNNEDRQTLLSIARESIAYGLQNHCALPIKPKDYAAQLQVERATFVTLHLQQQLRGCIGTLNAYQSLVADISHNAYAAAFNDPRFAPLSNQEFPDLDYHISILSDSSAMQFSSEEDLLSQLRPGIDGLILQDQGHRGTFLPSVWEQLPTANEFFKQLKRKAGLSSSHWSDTVQVSRYSVESFS